MSASAEWWGAIDEQMKKFKVNRLAVLKKQGNSLDPNVKRLSLRKSSKSSSKNASKSELAEPVGNDIITHKANSQENVPVPAIDDRPQLQGPPISVSEYAAFPVLAPAPTEEERRMANMTVTERMEYQLQKKTTPTGSVIDSTFDTPANPTFSFNSPVNAWDSLGGGNEGGW